MHGWGGAARNVLVAILLLAWRQGTPIDDAQRRSVVDAIARQLRAHYVFPDVAQRMADALHRHVSHGDYDMVTDSDAFAYAVTKDLRDVSNDLHMNVRFTSGGGEDWHFPDSRAMNFGFGAVERLPGNVARVVINGFFDTDDVPDAVAGFMTQVADADALIVDLRGNHGGSPGTVALVASYLFDPKPVHLNDIFWRDRGTDLGTGEIVGSIQEFWTLEEVKGTRFGGTKPVYVLTSRQTFSGGEELAYDLKCLHRATLIGETTGGGAHPGGMRWLGYGLSMFVPNGRPINPVTKTDWEGVGVEPDVAVPASAALDEALRRAAQR